MAPTAPYMYSSLSLYIYIYSIRFAIPHQPIRALLACLPFDCLDAESLDRLIARSQERAREKERRGRKKECKGAKEQK